MFIIYFPYQHNLLYYREFSQQIKIREFLRSQYVCRLSEHFQEEKKIDFEVKHTLEFGIQVNSQKLYVQTLVCMQDDYTQPHELIDEIILIEYGM